ncbi:hypothetical protein A4G26_12180 [Mycobacterium kansasii]|uniref:Uncharacterized protein n=2 Tax=Mycobacterium TaxID=1763 RepID=A0A498Q1H4_9MYCO|nr:MULTISPECIES: hypothetical protein [Mycobacterium]KZS57857.1 hypothetical protein A4G28_23760 [Mycobacterium ostraviense]KZS59340.1 hypothetical protein A4G26_12180 [Mycobacterium kansasii]VBA38165.1 hypothetical protein LAUMK13_01999 [Mycobacterium innocens]
MRGDPPLLTDSDVDGLAWEFLRSRYVDTIYAGWSPDRRLDTFLRRRGLGRVADDGDLSNIVLDRIMRYVGIVPRELSDMADESPVPIH